MHESFYGLDLKKGNGCLGGKPYRSLNSSVMKKMAADLKAKGRKHGCTHGCLLIAEGNECRSCKGTHSSLHVCSLSLSLSQTASRWLDSLAYVESITDAYSQYFVIDIEHTENNIQSPKCKLSLVPIT